MHAFVKFDRKVNFKDQKTFDFEEYHPNIQASRNHNATITYIKKYSDFIEFGRKIV